MIGEKCIAAYKTTAVILLNTMLLLGLLSAIYWVATWAFSPTGVDALSIQPGVNVISRTYGINPAKAYPDLSPKEVDELLGHTWGHRDLVFSPFVAFKERKYTSRFLNVNEFGMRRTADGLPWPPGPGPTIFVFGGSTTFGYGVADHHTIPFQLCKLTDCCVYNLGCAYYYSSQERALFQKLLARGIIPDRAIFIDGLNEFRGGAEDEPEFTDRFSQLLGNQPVCRVLDKVPQWRRAVELYLRNKRLIEAAAREFGVKLTFVWQPIRAFRFDRSQDLFVGVNFVQRNGAEDGYAHMEQLRRDGRLGANFLWLAEAHNQVKWPYIDNVHYSPAMCASLAELIAREVAKGKGTREETP